MDGNLYLIEIIYVVFYALLIVFVYLNYIAITNFSESYKIIIENASPQCLPKPQKLPFVSESDLIKCKEVKNNKGEVISKPYYYYNQNNNLAFIVSNNQADAGNFIQICNKYCPGNVDKTHKCTAPDKNGPYQKCIDLLQPPPKCTNSSVAIAIDKTNDSFFYAVKYADSGVGCA